MRLATAWVASAILPIAWFFWATVRFSSSSLSMMCCQARRSARAWKRFSRLASSGARKIRVLANWRGLLPRLCRQVAVHCLAALNSTPLRWVCCAARSTSRVAASSGTALFSRGAA